MATKRGLGWVPDLPDTRDFSFAAPAAALKALPPNIDLRNQCPKEVYDQGRLGSCTANAIAGASEFPFVFGFTVYQNFPFDTATGVVPMPSGDVLGGHAVLAVGYDDERHGFIFRNSWSKAWGNGGYGVMPYAYLLDSDLSDDFW